MITYDRQRLLLETEHTAYWISLEHPAPIQLYWGPHIDPRDAGHITYPQEHSSFDVELWRERQEYPVLDGRTFTSVCAKADVPLCLTLTDVQVSGEEAVCCLRDEQIGLTVKLCYRVYSAQDVIRRHVEVQCGQKPVTLTRLDSGMCCLPETDRLWTGHYTVGAWAGEFRRRTARLDEGELRLQSTRGMSGPHMNPSLIAAESDDEGSGLACAVMLGWSGSWQITASASVFGNHHVTAGFNDMDLRICLAPGEQLSTPPMYLCLSDEGMGGLSRRLHDFQRQVLARNNMPRRVLYNSWEATLFNVRAREQMALAERAARMGVELFVVDDGWFGQRSSDRAGLGDWSVNAVKFPHGLEELIRHVRGLGMSFGLWVEPESVNPDSGLYRAHSDWIYHLPSREPIQLRNQYLLNLGLPQVEAFVSGMLRKLLGRYDITYLKWDMNRSMADVSEQLTPMAREKHILALYRILDMLRQEFPWVDVEACSGGGARVDLGMIARTGQFWPSDNTDPYERLLIQEGCSLCYAPAATSCWVTDTPAGSRRDARASLRYKFHVAMCGTLGIGANINRFTDEELRLCGQMVAQYKQIRHLVQQGDLYRLRLPSRENVAALCYAAKDQSEAVLFVFLHTQRYGEAMPLVRLRGLQPEKRYICRETGEQYTGSTLMSRGIRPDLRGDFDSVMLHWVNVDTAVTSADAEQ